jgi:hypothetical protein
MPLVLSFAYYHGIALKRTNMMKLHGKNGFTETVGRVHAIESGDNIVHYLDLSSPRLPSVPSEQVLD